LARPRSRNLRIGDKIVNMKGEMRRVRWIGRRGYAGRFAAGNRDILPILIRAGALDEGVPRRDLMVSPLHAMYLDDVLIPARLLVNGSSIVQVEEIDQVEYFHIELDTHDVILAEGALSETFVDDGSRGMFINAAEFGILYSRRTADAAGLLRANGRRRRNPGDGAPPVGGAALDHGPGRGNRRPGR